MLRCPTCKVGQEVAPTWQVDPEEQKIRDLLALGPDQSSYLSEPETIVDDDEHGKGTAKGLSLIHI